MPLYICILQQNKFTHYIYFAYCAVIEETSFVLQPYPEFVVLYTTYQYLNNRQLRKHIRYIVYIILNYTDQCSQRHRHRS